MGIYLNQLPPNEVARLKAELAETLIANFCYPRFFDYRVNALRMRPVDRTKRQEVWQYLNAVDFHVWGRVDLDSPDFQRQVERLFIHFVQRNRNFFGEQGRRRMVDVRALITSCSLTLADGLRKHLQGKQENPPFGSPRPVFSWSTSNITGRAEPGWEQILNSTMQVQQQLQEVRGEARPTPVQALSPTPPTQSAPAALQSAPAVQAPPPVQSAPPPTPVRTNSVPSRRPRPTRPAANGAANNGSATREDVQAWPSPNVKPSIPTDGRASGPLPEPAQASAPAFPEIPVPEAAPDAAPTLPLPLGKQENMPTMVQSAVAPPEAAPPPLTQSGRLKRVRPNDPAATNPSTPAMPATRRKTISQPLPPQQTPTAPQPVQQSVVPMPAPAEVAVKPPESTTALISDEDVVIFEQMRHQLLIWLRVEAVRAGIELQAQGPFQLVDLLRGQEGVDLSRLQIISTLLNMCDQIISSGRATLFDYKQAMMFYLMHTRRSR